jgi:hypothetical protein
MQPSLDYGYELWIYALQCVKVGIKENKKSRLNSDNLSDIFAIFHRGDAS